MCFGTSLKRKRPQRFSLVQTVENIAKEAIKAYVIDRKITWVSSHRYPITKRSNRTPLIGHPLDHATITWQIDARRTKHDREFCYRYGWRALARQQPILYNCEKKAKSIGCKIVDMRSRLCF